MKEKIKTTISKQGMVEVAEYASRQIDDLGYAAPELQVFKRYYAITKIFGLLLDRIGVDLEIVDDDKPEGE
jgi:hypothetical protein